MISFVCIRDYLFVTSKRDPQEIVIDELCGQLISLLPILILNLELNIFTLLISLVTFRFFDITKIGLKTIEKLNGALGVLLDDIVAGVYSCLLQFLLWNFIS